MSSPRNDLPSNNILDILRIDLNKKSLTQFVSDLVTFSSQHKQPGHTTAKTFDRLYLETMEEKPSGELLYRLYLLKTIAPSKYSIALYDKALDVAAFADLNSLRRKYTREEMALDSRISGNYKFYVHKLGNDTVEMLANNKTDFATVTRYTTVIGEFKDLFKLLADSFNDRDPHSCINILLNFNNTVQELFPDLTQEQIKKELQLYQEDLFEIPMPNMTVIDIVKNLTTSVSLTYLADDEDKQQVLDNLRFATECLYTLVDPTRIRIDDLPSENKESIMKLTTSYMEKDFFPNAELRKKIADVLTKINYYGNVKRDPSSATKSDAALIYASELKILTNKYFARASKSDEDRVHLADKITAMTSDIRTKFKTLYKEKQTKGGLFARMKSEGKGPRMFDEVDEIAVSIKARNKSPTP